MSDIGINFPFWFIAAYFVVVGWPVIVLAIVVLVFVGWFVDMSRGWRVAAFGAAALLSVPLAVYAVLTINDYATYNRYQAETHRTLDHDETVAGLALPAGSEIEFTDKSRTHISLVRLSAVTDISGVRVRGILEWQDFDRLWWSTLARDQIVGGFPCAADVIIFDEDGAVYKCKLAAAHAFLGFTLPPGTTITRTSDKVHWDLRLPGNAGLVIPALATTAPPGTMLYVTDNGRLERAAGDGATMVVRGVPLNSTEVYFRGDHVVAALKEPFAVAGEMRPADTGVSIDLTTGDVALVGKNWWLSP